jgi:acetyltransferase EpsM
MRPLLILGTHLLAEEMTDLVSEIPGWQIAGYVENLDPDRCRTRLAGKPVYWIDDIGSLVSTHYAVCGISAPLRWQFVDQVDRCGMRFATLIHPLARISKASTIGAGSILSPGSIVASNTKLGRHVFVNRGVLVGHHTAIDDYVCLQPGSNIAGAVNIGKRTCVGMGAIVVDRISIGRDCMIAAGSIVTKDLPDNANVAGAPARKLRASAG